MATPTTRHNPLSPALPALLFALLVLPFSPARADDPPSLTLDSPTLKRAAERAAGHLPAPAA
ncbi:MAG: hypothetical protein IK066_10955, partial [Kiritimatiellae bacterium]|nr:hypothetical protein [Kiritimatiellia bacterium]